MVLRFTSDLAKARRNIRKHGLTFAVGEEVFDDPFVLIVEDCEDDRTGEMRYHAID